MMDQPSRLSGSKTPVVRCAVYTRKSTEENLELDYNSLDAQRDAAEAYITSQKSLGWTCLATRYDDGGFSGGNTDRPAFQQLMDDVEAGLVDCIVVYKIDRLSRSLMDFARIMEVLDRRNVSLVSVTQQFNTTTSMGRLTLNILLSFAQFEREIISERTRDKMAAARRKGKWIGGPPILGYDRERDNRGSRLIVNETEAAKVREIFEKFLKLGSISAVVNWLNKTGYTNKIYTTKNGLTKGGKDFDKSTMHKLLTNYLYIGKIKFNDQVYEGEHPAIVDEDLFSRVMGMLARNRNSGGKHQRNKYSALLKGLVRCKHCHGGMTHHYAAKRGKRYRYYVCQQAMNKGWANCPYPSLPAGELENFVIEQIKTTCTNPTILKDVVQHTVEHLGHQIAELKLTRTRQENRVKRINEDVCQLARAADAPGVASEMATLQEELRSAEKLLLDTNREIAELEARKIGEDQLTGAFEAFEPMWEGLLPDERRRVIHLLVQCVEYDGAGGEITISYNPGGLAAWQNKELALHE